MLVVRDVCLKLVEVFGGCGEGDVCMVMVVIEMLTWW